MWILVSIGSAQAAPSDRGFHAGVALGASSVDGASRAAPTIGLSPAPPATISIDGLPFDDTETSWTAFVGYAANRYVGIEGGYWDHGRFENDRILGPVPASLGITEWYFGATLSYPLTRRLELTGSAGVSRAEFDVKGVATVFLVPPLLPPTLPSFPTPRPRPPQGPGLLPGLFSRDIPLATPDSETGDYWRVGLQWAFTDKVGARFSYGKNDLKVQKVEALTLAVIVAF